MMPLPGRVAPVAAGNIGLDTDTIITPAVAAGLFASGFRFSVRYLSRTQPQSATDLSPAEATNILGAGLGLMAVQHCDRQGWSPTAALGNQYGLAAAVNATSVGLPSGVTIWLDLEGPLASTPAENVIAFVNAWASQVSTPTYNYVPGLYVGFQDILTSDQLYWRLRLKTYWSSASTVPDVAQRGYCMIQSLAPSPVDGISIDRDVVQFDNFGGVPTLLLPG
jgi:Domain of unknown function (DUF1906)